MLRRGTCTGDRGQAFPIYVVVVAGLLFAAFVFFVVGQASVTRSDAQGAADAAALAGAREARDGAFAGLDLVALKPGDWEEFLRGKSLTGNGACAAAVDFAAKNGAEAQCQALIPRVTVAVKTNRTVGKSVIPGTDRMHGTADAAAVIEPLCLLTEAPTPSATPTQGGATPAPTSTPTPPPVPDAVKFKCKDGKSIEINPLKPGSLRALSRNLFSVRLAD
ncbi:pilus assembly protein TadG-related protein [Streptomyces antarcticus]|uniref:pilus assembly protein TadG-related protein n=1 Tax=Streptomyces antarcticus TaxID=2996458 RepID=UPI002270CC73|nr:MULTISPECIES: pilus assembly protein TadG-related protein [unclassified Streptomyces]MCY0940694.1 pilus assembly protein TadG-related protein [Streptomyces sp. H34-AA3]MCZ4082038.1 pilus assembly protein TadG-related protein [Streptomyces sp. H34-S5]